MQKLMEKGPKNMQKLMEKGPKNMQKLMEKGPKNMQKLMEKGPKNIQTYTTHAPIPPSWQLDPLRIIYLAMLPPLQSPVVHYWRITTWRWAGEVRFWHHL